MHYLISCLSLLYYTLLYIEKEQKQAGKGRQEEREPWQRLDGLPSFPPCPRTLPSSGDGRAEQNEQTKQKEREPGRRMPPQSLPVPRLSSVPSAAFTVHTIASRSPLRPLVSSLRERDGRPPRPLLGDVIATTSPHLSADQSAAVQRIDGLPSCPPRPSPLPFLVVVPSFRW